jgi:hypothetical protein
MGRQSALGPIDPQFQMGSGSIPAHAIVKEFELALEQIKQDRQAAAFWVPKLSVLPHGHYAHALAAIERASSLVQNWLERYAKLDGDSAARCAEWLASSEHGSHGKPISFPEAEAHGLKVKPLEADQDLQNLVLAVFHTTMLTFDGTPCIKMVENHEGRGFYQFPQLLVSQQVQQPQRAQPS